MFNEKSIWLNDIPMPDFLIVTGASHDIIGDVTHDIADIPDYIGVKIKSTNHKPRSIIIDFKYRDSGFLDYEKKEEISNWIRSSKLRECKLEYSWVPGSYYKVVPSGNTTILDNPKLKSFSLEFILVNPCRIEIEEQKHQGSFRYIGTEKTYPILEFRVNSACNNIKLEFSNTSQSGFIDINSSFNLGDIIVIDCEKKSIKVNGEIKMPILSLDSDFPIIDIGMNNYNLTHGNVTYFLIYSNWYR